MLGAFAEFERDRIGERQKAAGEYSGGVPPWGYVYDADRRLRRDPEARKTIRRIKALAARASARGRSKPTSHRVACGSRT
jgi:DNA invertase Pin-like site-specific DNA recombinase